MPKIDFNSDSAPFSGAVLPTIEDVAALGDRLEKEVVDPIPRIDPARATTVQRMVLPFTFILAASVAVLLHLVLPDSSGSESSTSPPDSSPVPPELIPLEGVRDLRVIALAPTDRDIDLALRGAKTSRVTVVHSKSSVVPRREALAAARISLYPVQPSMVPSEGALLDGLRWYPLRPQPPTNPPPSELKP